MPLGILGGEAAVILVGLALGVALRTTGAEVEGGDVGAAIGGAKLRIAAEIADEKNDVGHGLSPAVVAGTAPSTALRQARPSGGAHRWRTPRGTPGQGRRGQPE